MGHLVSWLRITFLPISACLYNLAALVAVAAIH